MRKKNIVLSIECHRVSLFVILLFKDFLGFSKQDPAY